MGSAKDIVLRPISAQDANALVRRVHYSGKVVNNSQLHIGVFYAGRLEGALQFGPSLDKRKIQGLVSGTPWNGFLELNRMALTDAVPRNSESRALSVAMRLIRRHAPHVQWIITFADGTQCGDGTIYRAAGFVLTGIKPNNQIWAAPDESGGARESRTALTDRSSHSEQSRAVAVAAKTRESRFSLTEVSSRPHQERALRFCRKGLTSPENPGVQANAIRLSRVTATKAGNILETGASSMRGFIEAGFRPLPGYQLRYVYFLDPTARERLTVPELPFSEIERRGAGMYRGEPRATSIVADAPAIHAGEGGSTPTVALQRSAAE